VAINGVEDQILPDLTRATRGSYR